MKTAFLLNITNIFFIFFYNFIFLEKLNSCEMDNYGVKTVFIPISSGSNLYTQYHKPIYIDESENNTYKSNISLTYRFQRSNNSSDIAKNIFGNETLTFLGNNNINQIRSEDSFYLNNPCSIKLPAEYFGISNNSNISLSFSPVIQNQILDLQISTGNDLWLQINIPMVYSSYRMRPSQPLGFYGNTYLQDEGDFFIRSSDLATLGNLSVGIDEAEMKLVNSAEIFNSELNDSNLAINSNILNNQNNIQFIPIGYYQDINPAKNKENYIYSLVNKYDQNSNLNQDNIEPAANIYEALRGYTFGDLNQRLYNKFYLYDYQYHSTQAFWNVADLQIQIGYDFVNKEKNHFGSYIKMIIPTGTEIEKSWAEFLFTPVIGNARHFELGIGLTGHFTGYENECSDLKLFLDGYITHPFNNLQFRSFDKLKYPMTRYFLIKDLIKDEAAKFSEGADIYSYNYNLNALGDINNCNVPVSINLRGEFLLDLIYRNDNTSFGLGYSFSGQSKEKLGCCDLIILGSNLNYYGFKGSSAENTLTVSNTPIINTQWQILTNVNDIGIKSNNQVVKNASGNTFENNNLTEITTENDLFKLPDINNSGFMQAQILNKFFGHLDFNFSTKELDLFIGIIGSIGISPKNYITAAYWDIGCRLGIIF